MNEKEKSLAHEISMKFRRADFSLKRAIERRVRRTGVYRSQHQLLMHLNRQPNCSQVELADQLEVSPAAIAVSLKKLESGGYISRITDANDSRMRQVLITAKGKAVIESSICMFQEIECQMLEGFTQEELLRLMNYLERMHENLMGRERDSE